MRVIGISALYHDSAACLLEDGRLVAAAQEERFSRRKHDARLPVEAYRFCLEAGRTGPGEIDAVAWYESAELKLSRQLWSGPVESGPAELLWLDPRLPERSIRERLGYEGPILGFRHHLSHAASAFCFSGFPEAAILTVDGVGEWATTTLGRGAGGAIELLEEVDFPHSLGLLYSTLTAYLGFPVNDGEARVMGLAAHGRPRHLDKLRRLVGPGPRGLFALDLRYFDFIRGERMHSPALTDLLGAPPREPGEAINRFHRDLASSVQALLEELLLELARRLRERVDLENLCMAGGVALNCAANGRLRREGPFREIWIQPAAGDAGGCLGAAALAHRQLTGEAPAGRLETVYLGPSWSSESVARLISATGLEALDFRRDEASLLEAAAERLARRRVVGWFQGAMELGPRALGARSLLANPLDPEARDRLNLRIKGRESFRPFAPSVLAVRAAEHFELDRPSPFMLETCRVTSHLDLAAVSHVDGSARPQTVSREQNRRFARLLEAFERRTGCPLLLNTSFNIAGEPIVCSPADALATMGRSGIDSLVLEDFIIDREALPAGWAELLPAWYAAPPSAPAGPGGPLRDHLYTFV